MMKSSYTKEKGAFDGWGGDETPRFHKKTAETIFHVGQSSSDKPVPTIKCIQCGGTRFNVGSAEYFTAIRCPNCGWETGIHEG
jgi:ribosomal protein S27E